MVFNLQGSEIIIILLLALVVLGPEKLPDAVRKWNRTYGELKKMGSGFQSELKSALDEPMREMRETGDMIRDAANPSKYTDPPSPAAASAAPDTEIAPSDADPAPADAVATLPLTSDPARPDQDGPDQDGPDQDGPDQDGPGPDPSDPGSDTVAIAGDPPTAVRSPTELDEASHEDTDGPDTDGPDTDGPDPVVTDGGDEHMDGVAHIDGVAHADGVEPPHTIDDEDGDGVEPTDEAATA